MSMARSVPKIFSGWRRKIHQGQICSTFEKIFHRGNQFSPRSIGTVTTQSPTIHDGPGAIWRGNVVKDTSGCLSSFDAQQEISLTIGNPGTQALSEVAVERTI